MNEDELMDDLCESMWKDYDDDGLYYNEDQEPIITASGDFGSDCVEYDDY